MWTEWKKAVLSAAEETMKKEGANNMSKRKRKC